MGIDAASAHLTLSGTSRSHSLVQTAILAHAFSRRGGIPERNLWQRKRLRRNPDLALSCPPQFLSHGCHASFPQGLPIPWM
jgi:hypothetical protein